MSDTPPATTGRLVAFAIVALAILYAIALALGWPQYGTQAIVGQQAHHAEVAATDAVAAEGAGEHAGAPAIAAPPTWTVIPFVLMLAAIAILPLVPAAHHWWESNRNKLLAAGALALIALAYYAFLHQTTIEGHWPAHHVVGPGASALDTGFVQTILENAILQEYIPFIVLLFSLYTISGGIRIEGNLQAVPLTNAAFMAVGAALASFMAKAIAESSGIKMPSFFGYMLYSFAILLPILATMVYLFLM